MFGMTAFYSKGVIFAALPRTRSFNTPRSVAFKLYNKTPKLRKLLERDQRLPHPLREDAHWITFELNDEKDLKGALQWLSRAYQGAKTPYP